MWRRWRLSYRLVRKRACVPALLRTAKTSDARARHTVCTPTPRFAHCVMPPRKTLIGRPKTNAHHSTHCLSARRLCMFCQSCGKQFAEGAMFCGACGQPNAAREPAAPQPLPREYPTPNTNTPQAASATRQVSTRLLIGVILAPWIFAWLLLRPGYSKNAKRNAMAWLIITTGAIIAQGRDDKPSGASPSSGSEAVAAEQQVDSGIYLGEPAEIDYFEVILGSCEIQSMILTGDEYTSVVSPPGQDFLILSVTFRNIDTEGRMLGEGSAILRSKGREYEFDDTQLVLADGWALALESINPLISHSGKIAFGVPEGLAPEDFSWRPERNSDDVEIECRPRPASQTAAAPSSNALTEMDSGANADSDVPERVAERSSQPKRNAESEPSASRIDEAPQVVADEAPREFPKPTKPSFDCAKAGNATEHAICAEPALALADLRLSDAYRCAINHADGGAALLKPSQLAWVRQRNSCGNDARCIEQSYEKRLNELNATTGC